MKRAWGRAEDIVGPAPGLDAAREAYDALGAIVQPQPIGPGTKMAMADAAARIALESALAVIEYDPAGHRRDPAAACCSYHALARRLGR